MGNPASPPSTVDKEGSSGIQAFLPPFPVMACMTVAFWSLFSRSLIYTVMPTIGEDLRLSSSTVGAVIATMMLGYCLGFWFGARLPGRRRSRILAGTLLSIPAAVLISRTDSLGLLTGAALLLGFGIGVYQPIGISLIVDYGGTGRRARYMAMHEFSATTGAFCGSTSIALMLTWTDWRTSLLAACVVGLVAALAMIAMRDRRDRAGTREGHRERLPLDGRLLCGCLAQASVSIVLMGLISVLPLIMVRGWGIPQVEAASAVGYTRLAGLVGVVVTGVNADRWGHRRALAGFQVVSLIGVVTMSLCSFGPIFLVGMLVLAAGAVGTICLLPLVIAAAYPNTQREQALATIGGVGSFLGMVAAPALFGVLIDAGLATGPMVVAVAATAVAILATRRISLPASRQSERHI